MTVAAPATRPGVLDPAAAEPAEGADDQALELDQYLTFDLADSVFAVSVHRVREVLDLQRIARIANAPGLLLGMIHVRGEGVPVIDLKGRLGIGFGEGETEHSRIVVLEVPVGGGRELVVGAVTDAVYEVSNFGEEAIDPPPEFGERWDSSFMRGLARRNGGFVTVLDLARLFRADELSDILPIRSPVR